MTRGFLDDAAAAIDTPAVVIDIDRVMARIDGMADFMRARGVALRPHAKTHKSLEIGRRQIAAGAAGLTVATIGEAEVFAAGGIDDLFIAFPVIATGPKAARLRELAERCSLSVGVDSVEGLEALAAAVRGAARPPLVVIEIDTGGARTGVHPERAGALARRAADLGLEVTGAFTHGGHGYAGSGARAAAAVDEVEGLTTAADSLRAEGVEPGS